MKQRIEKTEIQEAIILWKKLGISYCEMEFSCGGDSMNDYSFNYFTDKSSQPIEGRISELDEFFDSEVFNKVEFYVNSVGYYLGESGFVTITLVEDGDELFFDYSKSAESEFSETFTEVIDFKLKNKEAAFISEYVNNINGGDGNVVINYKKDFIMSEELSEFSESLGDKINSYMSDYEIEHAEGEYDEWYRFNTSDKDGDELTELTLDGEVLKIKLWKNYRTYRDSE